MDPAIPLPSEQPIDCTGCDTQEADTGNYFVSSYPPFSCWNSQQLPAADDALNQSPASEHGVPLGLYVHIPFCAERCHYCYYRSYAKPTHDQTDRYIDTVLTELAHYARAPLVVGRPLDFAYFGGGTPSLLSADQIRRLLDGVQTLFPWDATREVTFECAPQSVTTDRLQALKDGGVTRVSIGVQQLDDDVLKQSGRIHRVEQVENAWSRIEPMGFPVVNLDLMVGLVGESEESFFRSLRRIIEINPMSVTLYLLEIPPNTPLFRALQADEVEQPIIGWDLKRDRLRRAFDELEQNGYAVRSAYAAVRDPERGRFIYQEAQYRGADLLAIGVSAFGYCGGVHYQNQISLEPYLQSVLDNGHARLRACQLSDEERIVREFVLQLKLGCVSADIFRDKFHIEIAKTFAQPLDEYAQRGWLTFDPSGVRLTRDGLLRVDRLLPAFYLPQHRDTKYW